MNCFDRAHPTTGLFFSSKEQPLDPSTPTATSNVHIGPIPQAQSKSICSKQRNAFEESQRETPLRCVTTASFRTNSLPLCTHHHATSALVHLVQLLQFILSRIQVHVNMPALRSSEQSHAADSCFSLPCTYLYSTYAYGKSESSDVPK